VTKYYENLGGNMKKLIGILLIVVLMFSIVGCESEEVDEATKTNTDSSEVDTASKDKPEVMEEAAKDEPELMEEANDYLDIFQTVIDKAVITEDEAIALSVFMISSTPEVEVPQEREGVPEGDAPPEREGVPEGEEAPDGERPPMGDNQGGEEMVSIFEKAAEEGIVTEEQAEQLDTLVEMPQMSRIQ
jgi:hypothetical protein